MIGFGFCNLLFIFIININCVDMIFIFLFGVKGYFFFIWRNCYFLVESCIVSYLFCFLCKNIYVEKIIMFFILFIGIVVSVDDFLVIG